MKKVLFALSLFIVLIGSTRADVKVARIFSSNMVLQQGLANPLWGWADKNERITIQFAGKTIKIKADKNGKWKTTLPVMEYGGPYSLVIEGKNKIELNDILIGEVWVCSGQSNMEWVVNNVNNSDKEIADANYPKIRMFTVPKKTSQFPMNDLEGGQWEECNPGTVGHFSAVGYFFARKLLNELNVPIGMIHTSWGGTVAETWISPENVAEDPDFAQALSELKQLDMDNYKQVKLNKISALFGGQIPSEDVGLIDGKALYADSNLKDEDWSIIKTPLAWENGGYPEVDGVAWYRTRFMLTKEQAQNTGELYLSKVDDQDMTWINGKMVGETNVYSEERIYKVPIGILQEGENVLAVRVVDTGGGGGIYGEDKDLFLKVMDERISLVGNWKIKFTQVSVPTTGITPNTYPTLLYNGMISPILPYGIKGAIWYQGESNASRAFQYQRVFKTLIKDWRQQWGIGDFPFLWVQLANFMQADEQPVDSEWAELREAQTMALTLPNTGMAVAIDIGEANDIHPRNKQDVGLRLGLNALKVAYHKDVVNSGPMFQSMEVNGNKAIIHFSETGSGLMLKNKYGYLNAFSIAGADKKFYWAKGEILDNNSVVVYSGEVENPVAVRFGWGNNPDDLNLYNKEGLPAVPFRTDKWKGITE